MTEQMSLFPNSALNLIDSLQGEHATDLDMAFNPVDEIFVSLARFKSGRGFMELIRFIAHFPNYSIFNGLLLYLQNPSATYVATARTWAQKHKRHPAGDAKPLVILAPMAPILFLFDIQDTEGAPIPSSLLRPREIDDHRLGKFYTTTLHNAALHGISVHETDVDGKEIDAVSRHNQLWRPPVWFEEEAGDGHMQGSGNPDPVGLTRHILGKSAAKQQLQVFAAVINPDIGV